MGLGVISGFVVLVDKDVNGWFGSMPSLEKFKTPDISHASLLYASDGVLLGKYYRKHRMLSQYAGLSLPLKKTLLAVEDRRFLAHAGIDMYGLLRAVYGAVSFHQKGGGSTLTMQLAENLYGTSTQNRGKLYTYKYLGRVITKFKEWIIAVELEKNFTKHEIMSMYLNTIPFGSNAFGIHAATKTFFDKTPAEIGYPEAAVLIGLINAPTRYNPILNPKKSLNKRNRVLYTLYKYNYISAPTYNKLRKERIPLQYAVDSHNRGAATYFRAVLKKYLIHWASKRGYDLFGDGLRIYTTIDSRMQQHAEAAVRIQMKALQEKFYAHLAGENPWIDETGKEMQDFLHHTMKRTEVYKKLLQKYGPDTEEAPNEALWAALNRKKPMRVFSWTGERDTTFSHMDSLAYYKHFLHAGFMALHPQTGTIKAWVGGINYKHFKFDHVLQGKRQPGSTIKPFIYAAVVDNGYNPCTEVLDQPITFHLPGQYPDTWTPSNAEGPPSGRRMTMRQAMARSVNAITAYWMQKVGIETVVRYAKRIGIKSPLAPVPALCLGAGGDVSVYELTGAYATFANKGTWTAPRFLDRIEDKDGNIIHQSVPERVEALSEETAYIMLHMLKGTVEERGGTSVGIPHDVKANNEIGAKTGTTQNASDGWFMGLTQELAAGAWVGGEDRSIHFRNWTMGQGARTAMPIWVTFMQRIYQDTALRITKKPFIRPVRRLSISLNCLPSPEEADSIVSTKQIAPEDIF